ncbi:MAG: 16S rRNA (guanine(527)-N(7))-methyltransferase RsmG [Bacteroidales bacterium]
MELIKKYFPQLNPLQSEKLHQLKPLYDEWNSKINVISRKDVSNFYIRHVLHSMAVAKVINFAPGTQIMDVGTGGGFPGIPLAILFPQCHFTLVDSIGKKIKVVDEIARELELKNVTAIQERAEKINDKFDFIVSRAVTALPLFMEWIETKIGNDNKNTLKNGALYLKGGDFHKELTEISFNHKIFDISVFFEEEYFNTKKIVHIYR